jgi:hypothetical protein
VILVSKNQIRSSQICNAGSGTESGVNGNSASGGSYGDGLKAVLRSNWAGERGICHDVVLTCKLGHICLHVVSRDCQMRRETPEWVQYTLFLKKEKGAEAPFSWLVVPNPFA